MTLDWESLSTAISIGKMFRNRSSHGVVDVFRKYALMDVLASILALANLQKIVLDEELSKIPEMEWNDMQTLRDLPHYANFSTAAYGWAVEQEDQLEIGDLNTLLIKTGLKEDDIVTAQWQAQTHRPAFFIVREKSLHRLVFCIRGTSSSQDVLTDLCCVAEDYETGAAGKHRAHKGILTSARRLAAMTEDIVANELEANPDFSLVIAGHSLGGGVAAVLGSLWEKRFPRIKVFCYGTPCVSTIHSKPTIDQHIISVIGEGDPFATLSLGHVANASTAIEQLCKNSELRKEILSRTGLASKKRTTDDMSWYKETMYNIRVNMIAETMLPPGRIIYLIQKPDGSVASKELKPDYFRDPRVHVRMLDLSKHIPAVYESLLAVLCAEMEERNC